MEEPNKPSHADQTEIYLEEETAIDLEEKDKIPLFNSWKAWYIFVLGFLVVLIVAFHFFTRYFS